MDRSDLQVGGIQQNGVTVSVCQGEALDLTALYGMVSLMIIICYHMKLILFILQSVTREQDFVTNLSNTAPIPCLSLSSSNAPALLDAYQSNPFENSMLSYHQPSNIVVTTLSGYVRTEGGVNSIAPLATPLFQLPRQLPAPAVINNFSDKVTNVLVYLLK